MLSPRSLLAVIAGLVVGGLLVFFLLRGSREEPGVPDTPSMVGEVTPVPDPRLLTDDGEPAHDAGAVSGTSPFDASSLPVVAPKLTGEVVDESGRPLVGAQVSLRAIDPRGLRGAPFPDGPQLHATQTDRNGNFEIDAPLDVWMRVTASADGYATVAARVGSAGTFVRIELPRAATLSVLVRDDDDKPVADNGWVEVQVGPTRSRGEAGDDGVVTFADLPPGSAALRAGADGYGTLRAGPIALRTGKANEVTVQLTHGRTLAGHVVDRDTETPIANAEVHIARPGESSSAGVTNAKGWFDPVHAGGAGERVFVAVRASGYAPALLPVVLDAAADEHQTVEVALQASADWSGQFVTANGLPVEGARVFYGADGVADRAPASTVTDHAGQFRLAPPPPPAPGRRVILLAEGEQGTAALALRPHQPQPQPLVMQLTPGFVVTGRVVDADDEPVHGALARIVPNWEHVASRNAPTPAASKLYAANERAFVGLSTSSDKRGAFAVRNVPEGPFEVVVRWKGRDRRPDISFDVNGANVELGTVRIGTGIQVEGRVYGPRGTALAGATVRVLKRGERVRSISAVTNAVGEYLFEDLEAGTYQLVASLPGFANGKTSFDLTEGRVEDVALEDAGRIDVDLRVDAKRYQGAVRAVLERVGRSPAPLAPRSLRAKNGIVTIDDVPTGVWRVRIRTQALQGSSDEIAIKAGTRVQATVELGRGAGLTGRVQTENGRAVPNAGLVLVHETTKARHVATGRVDGTYRFEGLEQGGYRLRATGRHGAPTRRTLTLGADGTQTLDVTLASSGAARVKVVDVNGRRLSGAILLFRDADGALPTSPPDRTGRDGVALRRELPEGNIDIIARAGELRGHGSAHVIKGRTQDVEIIVRSE